MKKADKKTLGRKTTTNPTKKKVKDLSGKGHKVKGGKMWHPTD